MAFLLLVLLAPVFALIATAVKLDSPGSAFFVQMRRGRFFEQIRVFKYRTMRNAADPDPRLAMRADDPRITRVGRVLRATSLDELPQLLCVLRGTMSLVGPRPLVERESQACLPRYETRFDVRPGITGLAQISGRNSLTLRDRGALDVAYTLQQSLWLDLRILLRTPGALLTQGGIYRLRRTD